MGTQIGSTKEGRSSSDPFGTASTTTNHDVIQYTTATTLLTDQQELRSDRLTKIINFYYRVSVTIVGLRDPVPLVGGSGKEVCFLEVFFGCDAVNAVVAILRSDKCIDRTCTAGTSDRTRGDYGHHTAYHDRNRTASCPRRVRNMAALSSFDLNQILTPHLLQYAQNSKTWPPGVGFTRSDGLCRPDPRSRR